VSNRYESPEPTDWSELTRSDPEPPARGSRRRPEKKSENGEKRAIAVLGWLAIAGTALFLAYAFFASRGSSPADGASVEELNQITRPLKEEQFRLEQRDPELKRLREEMEAAQKRGDQEGAEQAYRKISERMNRVMSDKAMEFYEGTGKKRRGSDDNAP
jgi:hypothetical protein